MAQYIVTLKKREELDGFYSDMKGNGYTCVNKRPISRATHYDLTQSQADTVASDSRVLAVELHPDEDPNIVVGPDGFVNNTEEIAAGEFKVGIATTENHRPWGQVLVAGNDTQRRKGSYWNVEVETLKWFNNGKHVDVVICDDNCAYDCQDWYSTEDPTKNRFVQYDWYAQHNAQVIGGIDDDGYSSPGNNYVEYFPNGGHTEYHGHHVTGTVAGKFYGWAREANIYNIQVLSGMGTALTPMLCFDYLRAFHRYKPINTETGHRNPTITNHSWSYRYNYEENYAAGIQIGDIDAVKFDGVVYDATNPNPSGWDMAGLEKDTGIGTWKRQFPIYYTSIAADIEDAIEDGVVVIGAAGNTDFYVASDATHPYWNNYVDLSTFGIRYYNRGSSPANAPGAICVGSIDDNGHGDYDFQKSSFSNYGEAVDIWAPGTNIVSVFNPTGTPDAKYGGDNYFATISGTSMASPQVCGVAALLASGKERFTNSDLKGFLQNYSKDNDMTFDANAAANTAVFSLTLTHSTSGWTVTGPDRYTNHNNATNPTIQIFEGDTVEFVVSLTIPAHPFYVSQFKLDGFLGTGSPPRGQVSWFPHQGVTSGTLNCTPPTGSAGDYYYQCGDTSSGHQSQHSVGWPEGILRVLTPRDFSDVSVGAGSVNKYLQTKNPRADVDGFPSRWYQQQLKGRRRDDETGLNSFANIQLYPRENVYHRGLGIHQQKSSNIVEDSYMIFTNHNLDDDHDGQGRIYVTNDEFRTIKDLGNVGNLNQPFHGGIILPDGTGFHQGYWGSQYRFNLKELTVTTATGAADPYGGWNHIVYDSVSGNIVVANWGSSARVIWSEDKGLNWKSNAASTGGINSWSDWDKVGDIATGGTGGVYPHGLVCMNGIIVLAGGNSDASRAFRSTDGGVTWTQTYSDSVGLNMFSGGLYAVPEAGAFYWYRKQDDGTSSGGNMGLYWSSDGVTWTWDGETTNGPSPGAYGGDNGWIYYSKRDNRYYYVVSDYRNTINIRRSTTEWGNRVFETLTPNIGSMWKITDMTMARDGNLLLFLIRKLDTATGGSWVTTDSGVICRVVKYDVASEEVTQLQEFHIGGSSNANNASYHYNGNYNFIRGYRNARCGF